MRPFLWLSCMIICQQFAFSVEKLMQAWPLRHLRCRRRLFCSAPSGWRAHDGDWKRRTPTAPAFRSLQQHETAKEEGLNDGSARTPSKTGYADLRPSLRALEEDRVSRTTRKDHHKTQRDTPGVVHAGSQSLLEELFPNETRKSTRSSNNSLTPREVPRRPFGVSPWDYSDNAQSEEQAVKHQHPGYSESHVLVLKNAGRCLIEEDFRRVAPSAGHLDGWNSAADLIKVIRGRDTASLDANGDYYLLFRNALAAETYKKHIRYLHKKAQDSSAEFGGLSNPFAVSTDQSFDVLRPRDTRSPTSRPDLPTKQGSLATYTLLLPSQRLDLRIAQRPYSPVLRQVLEQGGYTRLVRNKLTDHEVLLSVEGAQPSLQALQWAIAEDGHRRHMRWNIAGSTKVVREVLIPRSRDYEGGAVSVGDAVEDTSQKTAWKKWIVPCNTENEADRFVTAWHRRDIAPLLSKTPRADEEMIVNAEVLM